jgi:hypothetical protein
VRRPDGIGVVFVREPDCHGRPNSCVRLISATPIRASDQAAHQAQLVFARQADHVVHSSNCASGVSHHRQAKTLPARMVLRHLGCAPQTSSDSSSRSTSSASMVRLMFGGSRQLAQTPHAGHQFRHDAGVLPPPQNAGWGAQLMEIPSHFAHCVPVFCTAF